MPDQEEVVQLQAGRVDTVQATPSSFDQFAAVLWVPDPEQRHFWREFWVRKSPDAPKVASRGWGF